MDKRRLQLYLCASMNMGRRIMNLTSTKYLNEVLTSFNALKVSLKQYGHPPPAIVFTDNVRGDKNFLNQLFPHLKSVEQPFADETTVDVARLPGGLIPKILSTAAECDDVLAAVMHKYLQLSKDENSDFFIVGLDAEWNKESATADLVQLAFKEEILLIRICNMPTCPEQLQRFLRSSVFKKVGHKVIGDVRRVLRHYSLSDGVANGVFELADTARILVLLIIFEHKSRIALFHSPQTETSEVRRDCRHSG
ncbi:hypothetical protein V1520DRAFT_298867 [Lipomyces starkeyi]